MIDVGAFVIGLAGIEGLTAEAVAHVRGGRERNRDVYNSVFRGVDAVTLQAVEAELTGGQGGGSMIGPCPDSADRVIDAIRYAGYQAREVRIG